MNKTVVFTGGGTAGHVIPGLAVISSLKKQWSGNIVWIGSIGGMERKIVESAGIPYYGIPSGKLRRYFSLKNFIDFFKVLAALLCALLLLLRLKPSVIFSKGGYVSVPPVLAGKILGIYCLTHESDLDPGLATRINARFADRLLLSFAETANFFGENIKAKIEVTGNPVREEVLRGSREEGRKRIKVPESTMVLLILGGSQGSIRINRLIEEIAEELVKECFVIHQMGALSYRKSHLKGYLTFEFIGNDFPHFLAAADLVVSRAGANTLWELCVLRKPSILIPLTCAGSRGDQIVNAKFFGEKGAALVLSEKEATPSAMLKEIISLLRDRNKLESMGRAAALIGNNNATDSIVRVLMSRLKDGENESRHA
ncbi:MAG: undecaprenyldiphospho-muramoylpentapeptide beta-N-acetylglucosaminyltransferase [Spirochaetes bacterium]|nr:MAG: undecaprenyldiphospho-muramoylpentapeptide beta-N-acetylglucosaminyltransferase [Spirochaetota bacterium]